MITIDFTNLSDLCNKAYFKYLEDYRPTQIYKGGAGAGKSMWIPQKLIYNIVMYSGFNVMCVRKVNAENHQSTFAEMCKCISIFGLDNEFVINKSKGQEEIVFKGNKNKIIFKGLDDVRKLKSITFSTGDLVCIWCEEGDELTEDDFNELEIRLRGIGKIPKHIILSFNPIDFDHWIKKRFFDRKLKRNDGYICETTYKDNRFLDNVYKKRLESYKDIDYYYYQVYCLNQWGSRKGATVFKNIEIHDFDFKEYDYTNKRYGLDFGYNHAEALVGCGYIDNELYLFQEFYYLQTNNNICVKKTYDAGLPTDIMIAADSARPDNIAEWQESYPGVYGVKKKKGYLSMGIDYLKALPKIHIHATNCPNSAREFPRLKYKQIKHKEKGLITLDQVVEIDDDTIAATRYSQEEFLSDGFKEAVFIKGAIR
jgi:phage terminase large subunit